MKSLLSLVFFMCALIMPVVRSHIIVRRRFTDQLIEEFFDLPASFGGVIPTAGLRVYPLKADPEDGCSEQPTPKQQRPSEDLKNKKFVLIIARNNCTFEEKVRNAQNAKYDAAIIHNVGSDDLEQMSAKNSTGITIPSVFVGETSGHYITDYYLNDGEYILVINDSLPFNINKNLIIPLSVLIGLCFIIMVCYLIYKCVREQRRLNQHRLPKRLLKKIPIIKFTEGQPYDTCAICLEDYTKGERIRVLPCNHAYHCHCIDVWLTKNRRVCPICKRRVFVKSESRAQGRSRHHSSDNSNTDTDDDVQPLLNSRDNSNNHGTFPQRQQNYNNGNQRYSNNQRDVEQPTTDDENLLNNDSNSAGIQNNSSSRRENPFNRDTESDEFHDAITTNDTTASEGRNFWNIFKFGFLNRSDSLTTPLFNEIENPLTIANTVNPISVDGSILHTSSNNILNSNLSGSFQDNVLSSSMPSTSTPSSSTTVQISDLKKKTKSVATNINKNSSEHQSLSTSVRQQANDQNSDVHDSDVFIQTPSQGGIGVAALPNMNINNEQRNQNTNPKNGRNFFI